MTDIHPNKIEPYKKHLNKQMVCTKFVDTKKCTYIKYDMPSHA